MAISKSVDCGHGRSIAGREGKYISIICVSSSEKICCLHHDEGGTKLSTWYHGMLPY